MHPERTERIKKALKKEGIETTPYNINGFAGTGVDFDDAREQISDWLRLTGASEEEIEEAENEKRIEFKYLKDWNEWYVKFGERYVIFRDSYGPRTEYRDMGKPDEWYSDYVLVDGNEEVYFINNNALNL